MSADLATNAYDTLRSGILTGAIPGDTLWSDREIAARMNLSRTPVRDAMQRLAAEGLVEVIPRRGTRVLPLLASDVLEIHQIAKALELEAARLLARQNEPDLLSLHQAVDDMDTALAEDDREKWAHADTRFHFTVVDQCGNARLSQLYHAQRGLTDRARYFALYLRPLPLKSAQEHRAMLEALVARDEDQLAAIYTTHWDRTTDELVALVQKHQPVMPNISQE